MGRAVNRLSGGWLRRHALLREPVVRTRTIVCPGWPEALDGFRIAHISDFHVGEYLPVRAALRLLEPLHTHPVDLVAVTGDIVDFHPIGVGPLLEALVDLPARHGTWCVCGNHDHLVRVEALLGACHRARLPMLMNECVRLDIDGTPLVVSGIDWASADADLAELVARTCRPEDAEVAHVLLAHHPHAFDAAADRGVDLVLSGHTHGGQLNTRELDDSPLSPRGLGTLFHRYVWGVYEQGPCRLHVTSGVGSWFPIRIRAAPEIALLDIRSPRTQAHQPD